MKEIGIQVKDKIASLTDKYSYAVDYNSDYLIKFTFDDEWNVPEHYAKTARFWYNDQYIDVAFEGNEVQMPILVNANKVLVGAYSGNLHTTTPCTLYAKKAILDYGGKQIDPPESVYDQIMEMLNQRVIRGYYSSISKIAPYLYDIWYSDIDYPYAIEYFKKDDIPVNAGACTSVRKGNFFGRNYDWLYDSFAEFRVHTMNTGNRYASVGIAGGVPELTDEFVSEGAFSNSYRILPFYLLDGINERGVVASMNVVPMDKGENRSIPAVSQDIEISALMFVRYVVDNFESASDAVAFVHDHMSVYFPKKLHDMHYEIHYLIADKQNSYLVEFIDNAAVITDMTEGANTRLAGKPYMTNFYLSDVVPNSDGTVYTPANQTGGDPITTNHITDNGSGLERYNLIVDRYDSIETKQDMRDLMDDLMYTRAYPTSPNPAVPTWYTEFVGVNGLTCASTPEQYAPVVAEAGRYYTDRVRGDGKTWQSVHSSIYDLNSLTLYVVPQESGNEYSAFIKGDIPQKTSDLTNDGEDGVHPFASEQYVDNAVSGKQDQLIQGGASAGQIAKIKTVDANGKPTEWEATDPGSDFSVCEYSEIIEMLEDRGFVVPNDLSSDSI